LHPPAPARSPGNPPRLRFARYVQEGNEDGTYDAPTEGFRQTSDDRWAEHLDLASGITRPVHLDWTMVPMWIARELETVDQVAGTLTASRIKVDRHTDDGMHEIVFDACRTGAGQRIRYLDPQDGERPIRERLDEVFTFVTSPETKAIHPDSFAPRVALKVSLRRKLAVADGPAGVAAIPSGQDRKRKAEQPAEGLAKKRKAEQPAEGLAKKPKPARKADRDASAEPRPELPQSDPGLALWFRRAEALKKHARKQGIPAKRSKVEGAGVQLGRWASTQRSAYKLGTLTPAQIAALEAIPEWTWVRRFGPAKSSRK